MSGGIRRIGSATDVPQVRGASPSGSRRRGGRPRSGSGAAQALARLAELLVERDRGLVVREDVQLELRDAGAARPLLGRGEQRGADPRRRCAAATISPRSATCALAGCGSRAIERRPTIAPSTSATRSAPSGWRRIARMYRRSSATLRRAASASSQPSGSRADRARERDERRRVAGLGRAGRAASPSTTTPAPPRRGSPAAASEPSAQHLDRCGAAEEEVAPPPADDVVAQRLERGRAPRGSWPPSQWTCGSSRWTRGASIASPHREPVLEHVDDRPA